MLLWPCRWRGFQEQLFSDATVGHCIVAFLSEPVKGKPLQDGYYCLLIRIQEQLWLFRIHTHAEDLQWLLRDCGIMGLNIRELQLVELNIMKSVLAIIERNHLKYFMLVGTLLGAISHQGFIPWDDDMDIGMPWPDYEFFLQVAVEELPAHYQLHTQQDGKGMYSYYYARVEDSSIKLKRVLTVKNVIILAMSLR